MLPTTTRSARRRRPWRERWQMPLRRLVPNATDVYGAMWVAAGATYIVALSFSITQVSYDIWAALVIGPVLAGVTLPILRRLVARDDPTMVGLISAAFVVKMVGAVVRYLVTFGLYDDAADALSYHEAGSRIAQGYWAGEGARAIEAETPSLVGTPFIRVVTGLFYVVTGPTLMGGFLLFAFLSFLGLYLFYRALRIAFPEADHRRYAYLLFFLPTLLYWPSSIGKEAWMIFTLGLATYGIAYILKHQVVGYPYAAFGLVGTAMVRPHLTLLVFGALALAYVLRRRSWREAKLGPFSKAMGILVLVIGGALVFSTVASFFGFNSLDTESVESTLNYTQGQSSQGGSEFQAVRPSGPTDYPLALMAVLFRPYLWEAGNGQMAVAALEGTFTLGMCAVSWRRLARIPGFMLRAPYVAYCVAFIAMFVFAFSSISNFGIMTRQRAQVFPYMLVLLAVPMPGEEGDEDGGEEDEGGEDDDPRRRPRAGAGGQPASSRSSQVPSGGP